MAFLKSILTKYQVAASYWKVTRVARSNIDPKMVEIEMDGYLDQATRWNTAARPMDARAFRTTVIVLDQLQAENDVARAYLWIKANSPEFADAVDVLEDPPNV
jgi:hypothetical protein